MLRRTHADLKAVFQSAIDAVNGRALVRNALTEAEGTTSDRIWILGFGKAALSMAEGALDALGSRVTGGIVIVPDGYARPLPGLMVREAGHPIPDARGLSATRELLSIAEQAQEGDLVLVLVSGGGSALLVAPDPSLTLDQLAELTRRHLAAGTPIHELNAIRRRVSRVKGGRLDDRIAPARMISLGLSDVPDDTPQWLASGPTRNVRIVGNLDMAMTAASQRAEALGYATTVHPERLSGEARTVGAQFGALEILPGSCHIWGGETTVTVTGPGVGGRSQELALSAAIHIQDDRVLLAAGTDGIDGPTTVAGALVDRSTVCAPDEAERHLANNDSWTYLNAVDHHLETGPTETNVADLVILARPRT
jgi:glycerate-2-kinase